MSASFRRALILVLLPLFCLGVVLRPAWSAEPGKRFATVWLLKGKVTASREDGKERPLQAGDPVFVGERLKASATGEATLKTDDAGVIALRPGSELVMEDFAAAGRPSDKLTLRLMAGTLRIITGWIGKLNPSEYRLETLGATIGIRGTDHEPYVLSADLAAASGFKEGTYDKVNRGTTFLSANGGSVDIPSGKVGFARAPGKALHTRSLATLLLPALLEKVPDFYLPGQFDGELDRYSQSADAQIQKALERKRPAAVAADCPAPAIARDWLARLDRAVADRNAEAALALFAPEVVVQAAVRGQDGQLNRLELGRDELVRSSLAALENLKDFQQRRLTQEGSAGDEACRSVKVKSVVIEQGRQSGPPYRLETQEDYLLELRDGRWLATKATTTQR